MPARAWPTRPRGPGALFSLVWESAPWAARLLAANTDSPPLTSGSASLSMGQTEGSSILSWDHGGPAGGCVLKGAPARKLPQPCRKKGPALHVSRPPRALCFYL